MTEDSTLITLSTLTFHGKINKVELQEFTFIDMQQILCKSVSLHFV